MSSGIPIPVSLTDRRTLSPISMSDTVIVPPVWVNLRELEIRLFNTWISLSSSMSMVIVGKSELNTNDTPRWLSILAHWSMKSRTIGTRSTLSILRGTDKEVINSFFRKLLISDMLLIQMSLIADNAFSRLPGSPLFMFPMAKSVRFLRVAKDPAISWLNILRMAFFFALWLSMFFWNSTSPVKSSANPTHSGLPEVSTWYMVSLRCLKFPATENLTALFSMGFTLMSLISLRRDSLSSGCTWSRISVRFSTTFSNPIKNLNEWFMYLISHLEGSNEKIIRYTFSENARRGFI